MILADIKSKLKPEFRFIGFASRPEWGTYNWEVLRLVERGVVAQMYYEDWSRACRGHQHLVEWQAQIKEIGT